MNQVLPKWVCRVLLAGMFVVIPTAVTAASLVIETGAGLTRFYAQQGDTVKVAVSVDAEGEILTGVELFLSYDRRLFEAVDRSPEPGIQPAVGASLLGDILADSLLTPSDSLGLVHYAEASLTGGVVSGLLLELQLVVLGDWTGSSAIAAFQDSSTHRLSVYTVSGSEGLTFQFKNTEPLLYANLPPVIMPPDTILIQEDGSALVDLREFASDSESPADLLTWEVVSADANISVKLKGASEVILEPGEDFHGHTFFVMEVRDPPGGSTAGEFQVFVLPVNDAPEILEANLPDSIEIMDRSYTVTLEGVGVDVDDGAEALVWTVGALDTLQAETVSSTSFRLFAPVHWVGSETVVFWLTDASGESARVSLVVYRQQPLQTLPGDFDGNGEVDFSDFVMFVQNYQVENSVGLYDLTGDGKVNLSDFLVFAQNYGKHG